MNRFDRALGKTPEKLPQQPGGDAALMGYVEKFGHEVEAGNESPSKKSHYAVDGPELAKWLAMHENEAVGSAHHGIGQWIRNNWHMWDEGSEVAQFFKGLGIFHADDMSAIVMMSYHRFRNGKPIDIEGQVKGYQDYWKKNDDGWMLHDPST